MEIKIFGVKMARKVKSGAVYGLISSWYRELEKMGLAPSWVHVGLNFQVSLTEPRNIGKFRWSLYKAYTLEPTTYMFVRGYVLAIPLPVVLFAQVVSA